MKFSTLARIGLAFLVFSIATACTNSRQSAESAALERTDGTANQQYVVEALHRDGLLTVPEVKAKSDYYIQQYRTRAMTREAAAKEFRIWLQAWVKKNPEKAERAKKAAKARAKMAPGGGPVTAPTGR